MVFFSNILEQKKWKFNIKFLIYILWLAKEIFVSALGMIKIIFFCKKENIKPIEGDVTIKSQAMNENAIYANSITLTPGTITMKMGSGKLKVHAISESHYKSLVESDMYKKIIESQE